MMPPRVTIVADDLTGAMDVAGPFADHGLDTRAVASIEGCRRESLAGAEVVSINADTRHLPAEEAASRVRHILRALVDGESEILIKKIDSTLRGNVVAETLAMLEASGRRLAVVAPAFPAQGRTVVQGVVHVRNIPLKDTNFARDALTPPPLDPLHVLFARAAVDARVQQVGAGESLPALAAGSKQIYTVDAAADGDLRATLRTLQGRFRAALLVGSSGIAEVVADLHFERSVRRQPHPAVAGTLLFVVGSRAEQSAQQVACLAEQEQAHVVPAPNGAADIDAAAAASSELLVLKATPGTDGREGDSDEVARGLAESVAGILRRLRVAALVVTGGDTAIAVLRRLAQPTLNVMGNLLPGIPFSRIQAGGASLWFVTKAGGFGAPETFVNIARRLRSRE